MAQNTLTITRGNTLIVNYTNQDNSTPPNPISLAGATIYFTVKPVQWDTSATDSTAVFQLVSSGNTGNTCTFTASAAQTENLLPTNSPYYWDITILYPNQQVITPMSGQLKVMGTPTNRAS